LKVLVMLVGAMTCRNSPLNFDDFVF